MLNDKLIQIFKKIDKNQKTSSEGFCYAFSLFYTGWRLQSQGKESASEPWPFNQIVSFIIKTSEETISAILDHEEKEEDKHTQALLQDEGLTRSDLITFFHQLIHFQYSDQAIYQPWSIHQDSPSDFLNFYSGKILQEKGGATIISSFSSVFDLDALSDWLVLISEHFRGLPICAPFMLSSDRSNHAISIVFEENQWRLVDINLISQKDWHMKTYRLNELDELTKDIGYSFDLTQQDNDDFLFMDFNFEEDAPQEKQQSYLSFSLFSTAQDATQVSERLAACKSTKEWQKLFSLDERKNKYEGFNILGKSFFHNQALYNDSAEAVGQLEKFIQDFPAIFQENISFALQFSIKSSIAFHSVLKHSLLLGCLHLNMLAYIIQMKVEKNLSPHQPLSDILDRFEISYEKEIAPNQTWADIPFSLAIMEGNTAILNKIQSQAATSIHYPSAIKTAAQYGRNEILFDLVIFMNQDLKKNLLSSKKTLDLYDFFSMDLFCLETLLEALKLATLNGHGETVRILLSWLEKNTSIDPATLAAYIEKKSLVAIARQANEPGILAMLQGVGLPAITRTPDVPLSANTPYFFQILSDSSDSEDEAMTGTRYEMKKP